MLSYDLQMLNKRILFEKRLVYFSLCFLYQVLYFIMSRINIIIKVHNHDQQCWERCVCLMCVCELAAAAFLRIIFWGGEEWFCFFWGHIKTMLAFSFLKNGNDNWSKEEEKFWETKKFGIFVKVWWLKRGWFSEIFWFTIELLIFLLFVCLRKIFCDFSCVRIC